MIVSTQAMTPRAIRQKCMRGVQSGKRNEKMVGHGLVSLLRVFSGSRGGIPGCAKRAFAAFEVACAPAYGLGHAAAAHPSGSGFLGRL